MRIISLREGAAAILIQMVVFSCNCVTRLRESATFARREFGDQIALQMMMHLYTESSLLRHVLSQGAPGERMDNESSL